ncbi:MAG TPA: hypothetical protein VNT79_02165 [Phycisphaerae bacterium]|nr:hypothetical protein [Phycisphaerae bacterium]
MNIGHERLDVDEVGAGVRIRDFAETNRLSIAGSVFKLDRSSPVAAVD